MQHVAMVSGMDHHTLGNRVCRVRCSMTRADFRQPKLQVSASSNSKLSSNFFRNSFQAHQALQIRCFLFRSGIQFLLLRTGKITEKQLILLLFGKLNSIFSLKLGMESTGFQTTIFSERN